MDELTISQPGHDAARVHILWDLHSLPLLNVNSKFTGNNENLISPELNNDTIAEQICGHVISLAGQLGSVSNFICFTANNSNCASGSATDNDTISINGASLIEQNSNAFIQLLIQHYGGEIEYVQEDENIPGNKSTVALSMVSRILHYSLDALASPSIRTSLLIISDNALLTAAISSTMHYGALAEIIIVHSMSAPASWSECGTMNVEWERFFFGDLIEVKDEGESKENTAIPKESGEHSPSTTQPFERIPRYDDISSVAALNDIWSNNVTMKSDTGLLSQPLSQPIASVQSVPPGFDLSSVTDVVAEDLVSLTSSMIRLTNLTPSPTAANSRSRIPILSYNASTLNEGSFETTPESSRVSPMWETRSRSVADVLSADSQPDTKLISSLPLSAVHAAPYVPASFSFTGNSNTLSGDFVSDSPLCQASRKLSPVGMLNHARHLSTELTEAAYSTVQSSTIPSSLYNPISNIALNSGIDRFSPRYKACIVAFNRVIAYCEQEKIIPRESVVKKRLLDSRVGVELDFEELVNVVHDTNLAVVEGEAPQRILWPRDSNGNAVKFACVDFLSPQSRLTVDQSNDLFQFLLQYQPEVDRGRFGFAQYLARHGPTSIRVLPHGLLVELVQLLLNKKVLIFRKGRVSISPAMFSDPTACSTAMSSVLAQPLGVHYLQPLPIQETESASRGLFGLSADHSHPSWNMGNNNGRDDIPSILKTAPAKMQMQNKFQNHLNDSTWSTMNSLMSTTPSHLSISIPKVGNSHLGSSLWSKQIAPEFNKSSLKEGEFLYDGGESDVLPNFPASEFDSTVFRSNKATSLMPGAGNGNVAANNSLFSPKSGNTVNSTGYYHETSTPEYRHNSMSAEQQHRLKWDYNRNNDFFRKSNGSQREFRKMVMDPSADFILLLAAKLQAVNGAHSTPVYHYELTFDNDIPIYVAVCSISLRMGHQSNPAATLKRFQSKPYPDQRKAMMEVAQRAYESSIWTLTFNDCLIDAMKFVRSKTQDSSQFDGYCGESESTRQNATGSETDDFPMKLHLGRYAEESDSVLELDRFLLELNAGQIVYSLSSVLNQDHRGAKTVWRCRARIPLPAACRTKLNSTIFDKGSESSASHWSTQSGKSAFRMEDSGPVLDWTAAQARKLDAKSTVANSLLMLLRRALDVESTKVPDTVQFGTTLPQLDTSEQPLSQPSTPSIFPMDVAVSKFASTAAASCFHAGSYSSNIFTSMGASLPKHNVLSPSFQLGPALLNQFESNGSTDGELRTTRLNSSTDILHRNYAHHDVSPGPNPKHHHQQQNESSLFASPLAATHFSF